MIQPEMRQIFSPDLSPPALPDDPDDCTVRFQAWIGPRGSAEEEAFAFTVTTPARLAREGAARWGRGLLVVPAFGWDTVVQALASLLLRCARDTWGETAGELRKELAGEID